MRLMLRMVLMAVMLIASVTVVAEPRRKHRTQQKDTTAVERAPREVTFRTRMSISAYPVRIEVKGRAVCIQSDNDQILPIYTSSGAFYMAMRLQKGTNWLNGLPRGSYLINNRPVSIN